MRLFRRPGRPLAGSVCGDVRVSPSPRGAQTYRSEILTTQRVNRRAPAGGSVRVGHEQRRVGPAQRAPAPPAIGARADAQVVELGAAGAVELVAPARGEIGITRGGRGARAPQE